jgi:hypothetical protein
MDAETRRDELRADAEHGAIRRRRLLRDPRTRHPTVASRLSIDRKRVVGVILEDTKRPASKNGGQQ